MSDTKDLLKMIMKWLLVPVPKRRKYSEPTNEDSDYSKHKSQTVNTKPIGTNHFYGFHLLIACSHQYPHFSCIFFI